MRRQWRLATGAIGQNFETLIDQIFFPELIENPPQCLNVFVFEGDIRVIEIEPVANALGEAIPFFLVGKNALFTIFR